jgi:hypothetical protein
MQIEMRLRQLPYPVDPQLEIKHAAHGLRATPNHPRALRASVYICDKFLLLSMPHGSRAEKSAQGAVVAKISSGGSH